MGWSRTRFSPTIAISRPKTLRWARQKETSDACLTSLRPARSALSSRWTLGVCGLFVSPPPGGVFQLLFDGEELEAWFAQQRASGVRCSFSLKQEFPVSKVNDRELGTGSGCVRRLMSNTGCLHRHVTCVSPPDFLFLLLNKPVAATGRRCRIQTR